MNKIFFNGKIYTMDKNNYIAQAIYVEECKIKQIGTNEEILSMKQNVDEMIDLKGKTVVPGFNDSHMHLLMYGKSLNEVDLSGVNSAEEVIERSKEFLKNHKLEEGGWLTGGGWNHELFENKNMINRYDLDKISTEIPIIFSRVCFHIYACNTKALELASITGQTTVDGGEVEVIDGHVTGVLKENGASLVLSLQPEMSRAANKECILRGMQKLSAFGVTSIHSDDLEDDSFEVINIYKEIELEGKMDVRVYQQCRFENVEGFQKFLNKGYKTGMGSDSYRLGTLKILADGSLGGRTAYMNETYTDDSTTCGITMFTQDEINNLVEAAHDEDMAVAIHAIGDKTIDMAINAITKAQAKKPKPHIRHGIVHAQITSEESLKKFKENNILAYIQPIFVSSDYKIVELRVGKERAKYSYNWKTLCNDGVCTPIGTDTPVETPNPYENIYCAVERADMRGRPEGGWLPKQKLTVKEAIKGYTYDSAYASLDEDKKGTLEIGKYADMAVLSDDIFEINQSKIKEIQCIMTVKDGKIVFKSHCHCQ